MSWPAKSMRYRCIFDIAGAEREIAALEDEGAAPTFWDDAQAAGRKMSRLSALKGRVDNWKSLAAEVSSLHGMLELVAADPDPELQREVELWTDRLAPRIDELEFETLLSGEYADRGAILAVHAGAGGTESQDWADMLLRMYIRWAESRDYSARSEERRVGRAGSD